MADTYDEFVAELCAEATAEAIALQRIADRVAESGRKICIGCSEEDQPASVAYRIRCEKDSEVLYRLAREAMERSDPASHEWSRELFAAVFHG